MKFSKNDSNRVSSVKLCAGSHLLSHTVSSVVPSAAYVLTIVFGMGTGVSHKRITTGKVFELSSFEMLPICAFASQKLNRRPSPYARFL